MYNISEIENIFLPTFIVFVDPLNILVEPNEKAISEMCTHL